MKLDLPGAVTVTGGLLAVIYTVIEKNIPAAVVGVLLLVKRGNYAGLVVFTMEPAMIFLMTLYLQQVLGFSPLITGLIFGVPGLASVAAGAIAGRASVLIPALFIGFFGHVTSIVAFMVTGTSGLPNKEQGLATGLTSMTQQVGITIGIPVLGSVAATQTMELTGIHLALTVNVAVKLVSVVLIWFGLRLRGDRRTATTAAPAPKEADKKRAACPD